MSEKLRFTGDWPPKHYLNQYPNWTNALDEEGEEDQDETTLKPSDEQGYIDDDTVFTVADATLADGSKRLAVVQVYNSEAEEIDVFEGDVPWRLRLSLPDKKWVPFVQYWLPEAQRMPSVSPEDTHVFPLYIISRLPTTQGGIPLEVRIDAESVAIRSSDSTPQ